MVNYVLSFIKKCKCVVYFGYVCIINVDIEIIKYNFVVV